MISFKSIFLTNFFFLVVIASPDFGLASKISVTTSNTPKRIRNPRISQTDNSVSPQNRPRRTRKLYLNFANNQESRTTENTVEDETVATPTQPTGERKAALKVKAKPALGFKNSFNIGYSNSAYRYAGEDYPAKSIDLALTPSWETTCFSIKCILAAKMLAGFDLNNSERFDMGLFQLSLKFPGDPWGGYFTPIYAVSGYVPATRKEINEEKMVYGAGAGFSLGTTPELMGGEFLKFVGSINFRKNVQSEILDKSTDWVSRQALTTTLNFTKSINAEIVFGHIWGITYDRNENEILEMSQALNWNATDWLELSVGHGNIGPMFNDAGQRMDTDFVSINNSVLSLGIGINSAF